MIHLGKTKLSIDTYASQGNAVLGIRGSGKTYTATWIAEQLLDAGVPFVAFDPIGVWRFMKVPGKGHGFKVVVAGQDGDLPLTPQSAPEIVRGAMRENIPLVLDLYSMRLSKADWKTIVQGALQLLLYENKDCGLRHVFIEEAAEFAPQMVGPDTARVYAEVEKLARMGGNASLGYTLINQRAEQVNKAVLENCDTLILHRQKGRRSLEALEKWLEFADDTRSRDIVKSLPTLAPGHAWLWTEGSNAPELVQVPEKKSFHPDRKNPKTAQAAKSAIDVVKFVDQLKDALGEESLEKVNQDDPAWLKERIRELEGIIRIKDRELSKPKGYEPTKDDFAVVAQTVQEMRVRIGAFEEMLDRHRDALNSVGWGKALPTPHGLTGGKIKFVGQIKGVEADMAERMRPAGNVTWIARTPRVKSADATNGTLTGGARRMLIALAQRPQGLTKQQLGLRAGLASSSGTFSTYLGRLRAGNLVADHSGRLIITREGLDAVGDFDPLPTGRELLSFWLNNGQVTGGARRMLSELVQRYPESMTARELAEASEMTGNSGTFSTYLGRLKGLELVQGKRDALKASDEFFV